MYISVRESKFLGVRRILPAFSQTCPKGFVGLCLQNASTKIKDHENLFWYHLQKRPSCVFLEMLGVVF